MLTVFTMAASCSGSILRGDWDGKNEEEGVK